MKMFAAGLFLYRVQIDALHKKISMETIKERDSVPRFVTECECKEVKEIFYSSIKECNIKIITT
jgi:hypothetical protein